MSGNKRKATGLSLQTLVVCALLTALSLVCGKFLAISVGNVLRFSLENLPILLAGMLFGPVAGMLVGVVADLLGCLAVGYAINPLVTVGAAIIGLLGGLLYRWLSALPMLWRVVLTVLVAHLVGSVVVKTIGLSQYYQMPFVMLTLWRLLNYILVAAVEAIFLRLLMKNPELRRMEIPHDTSERKKKL